LRPGIGYNAGDHLDCVRQAFRGATRVELPRPYWKVHSEVEVSGGEKKGKSLLTHLYNTELRGGGNGQRQIRECSN